MNKQEVLNVVKQHFEEAQDLEVEAQNLRYHQEGYLLTQEDKETFLSIGGHAEGQFLTRLGIPILYKKRCPFWLAQSNIHYWLESNKERKFKLRLLMRGEKPYCRAVVTPRYVAMDDIQVMPEILAELEALAQGRDDLSLEYTWSPDFSELRAYYNHLIVQYDNLRIQALVTITNSETGMASLKIQPTLRVPNYPWSNALDLHISDKKNEGVTSIRHLKEFSPERVRKAIQKGLQVAQVGVARALAADREQVVNPYEIIENFIHHNPVIPKLVLGILEDEWKLKEISTKLQVGVALLDALQTLPLFARHQAECEVGRYLNLFQDSSKRLGKVLANILLEEDNSEDVPEVSLDEEGEEE